MLAIPEIFICCDNWGNGTGAGFLRVVELYSMILVRFLSLITPKRVCSSGFIFKDCVTLAGPVYPLLHSVVRLLTYFRTIVQDSWAFVMDPLTCSEVK